MDTQTMRRLWALIKWLPRESAFIRSLELTAPAQPANGISMAEFAQRHSNRVA